MTPGRLQGLIAAGESIDVEFKKEYTLD